MKEFTLNAKLVRAAMLFQANNDVRYYLNGFGLSASRIAATNGCVAWWYDFETPIDINRDLIIKLNGKLHKNAESVKFKLDDEKSGVAYCLCPVGVTLDVIYFELIDGKYPNFDERVIPKEAGLPTAEIGLKAEYLHLIQQAANLFSPKFDGVNMVLFGNTKPVLFHMPSLEFKSFAVIMPCRL